jgi:hypothetical protein
MEPQGPNPPGENLGLSATPKELREALIKNRQTQQGGPQSLVGHHQIRRKYGRQPIAVSVNRSLVWLAAAHHHYPRFTRGVSGT